MPFRRVATRIGTVGHRANRLRPLRKTKADKPEEDRGIYDISIFHTLVLFHSLGPSLFWVFTQVLQEIWRDITRKVFLRSPPLQFTSATFVADRG